MQPRALSAACAIFCLAFGPLAFSQQSTPSIILRDPQGHQHTLQQYKGKVVLLNFWATWCAPCLHEMPVLAEIAKAYSSQGLVLLGASLDEAKSRPAVEAAVIRYKMNYPIFIDVDPEEMQRFGVENVPATILLDRQGHIAERISGEVDQVALSRKIEELLLDHQKGRHAASLPH